jgi:hypothetical protein
MNKVVIQLAKLLSRYVFGCHTSLTLPAGQAISFGFLGTLDVGNVLLVLLHVRLRIRNNHLTVTRLDLFIVPLSGADPSSRFLFCPEDEIRVLLVVIPRPVKHPTLLLDLPRRLLLVLEFALLDSAPLSTQEACWRVSVVGQISCLSANLQWWLYSHRWQFVHDETIQQGL